jgi:iron complex transport system substrate-binding protein
VSVERIVSLVPGATETLFELGVGDRVEAVSHACDHPPEVAQLPTASRTRIDPEAASRAIDEEVRSAVDEGEPMFEVLQEVLHHAQPDLVFTQEACDVCGITPVDVEAAFARIEPVDRPEMVTLHPHTLDDVIADVERIGEAAGVAERGAERAGELRERVQTVASFAADAEDEPRVAALDWLDPPMAAGHWVPGMIETAGGDPGLLDDASPSTYVEWDDVEAADPDVLLSIPCGFDARRALAEADAVVEPGDRLPGLPRERVVALDAGAYTSRPGPRLVDGLEQIACALHGPATRQRWPEQATRVQQLGRRA